MCAMNELRLLEEVANSLGMHVTETLIDAGKVNAVATGGTWRLKRPASRTFGIFGTSLACRGQ